MHLGVNVPNFGPGTNPAVVRQWAQVVEGGVGWARQEYQALGVAFEDRGRLTDAHLRTVRAAWVNEKDYRSGRIPIWVGGNSDAGIRRAVRLGDAWHPIDVAPVWLEAAVGRMKTIAGQNIGTFRCWLHGSGCG